MCKDCKCGEHDNTQKPITIQDLAIQYRNETGTNPEDNEIMYRIWLENKVLADQNHQKTIKTCNDEINKVNE